MSLKEKVMVAIKSAMKEKNKIELETLRAIKSEILLLETKSSNKKITTGDEIKLVQKLYKQRQEAASQFKQQNREDLEKHEILQANILKKFLPKQYSEEEISEKLKKIISETNATSKKDFGKVMQVATKLMLGKADGKKITEILKNLL